ncbi:hypothetical protein AeRB84_005821 [Aphanomyces euteiches]|nr:hypothetical protein AeRB84_005821 [Aphanomyces euteiches]
MARRSTAVTHYVSLVERLFSLYEPSVDFGLRINLTGDIFQVQSLIQRVPAGPASFVLDSVPRRVERLLNGEPWIALDPTMIQGDYIGWRENNTLLLWLYGWPKIAGGLCYVLQLRVLPESS